MLVFLGMGSFVGLRAFLGIALRVASDYREGRYLHSAGHVNGDRPRLAASWWAWSVVSEVGPAQSTFGLIAIPQWVLVPVRHIRVWVGDQAPVLGVENYFAGVGETALIGYQIFHGVE